VYSHARAETHNPSFFFALTGMMPEKDKFCHSYCNGRPKDGASRARSTFAAISTSISPPASFGRPTFDYASVSAGSGHH